MAATDSGPFPELCVFDLDECLWSPEMYTLSEIPTKTVLGDLNGKGQGVVGVKSGGQTIRLYPGALIALQEVHSGRYPGMKIAAASSADTPQAVRIGRKALTMLEVVPGVTVQEVFSRGFADDGNMQIGRTPPLSSDKAATHFPILKKNTGVEYDKMLFFDDCNWGDHCAKVEARCQGVVTQRTPHGLTESEWRQALEKYARAHSR